MATLDLLKDREDVKWRTWLLHAWRGRPSLSCQETTDLTPGSHLLWPTCPHSSPQSIFLQCWGYGLKALMGTSNAVLRLQRQWDGFYQLCFAALIWVNPQINWGVRWYVIRVTGMAHLNAEEPWGDSSRVIRASRKNIDQHGWWDSGLVTAVVLLISLCFKHAAWPFKEKPGLLYKGHIYYGDTTLYTKYSLTF